MHPPCRDPHWSPLCVGTHIAFFNDVAEDPRSAQEVREKALCPGSQGNKRCPYPLGLERLLHTPDASMSGKQRGGRRLSGVPRADNPDNRQALGAEGDAI